MPGAIPACVELRYILRAQITEHAREADH